MDKTVGVAYAKNIPDATVTIGGIDYHPGERLGRVLAGPAPENAVVEKSYPGLLPITSVGARNLLGPVPISNAPEHRSVDTEYDVQLPCYVVQCGPHEQHVPAHWVDVQQEEID